MMDIEQRIRACLAPLDPVALELHDESGLHVGHPGAMGGGHYRLTLVSELFSGKNRVTRHRMVYAALDQLLRTEIHALALTTQAPAEVAAARPV